MSKEKFLSEAHERGAILASARGAAFSLLNNLIKFMDYERRAESADHLLESVWFGKGAVIRWIFNFYKGAFWDAHGLNI